MPIDVDGEHRVHVPIRGKHVQPPPNFGTIAYYKERGIDIRPDGIWKRAFRRLRRLFLWWRYE